ncbi:hypothetical protein JOL79_33475 [Microbispora sp. RL4-1S]|uniref:Trypsin-co-occurring domain-containing protein n=1 Tax=Microbispora oryzae TaxID=2806554 RepID=A0A940WSP1_9ACTN|nr:trypco2 family protein [Microbispora oryzae]MBP2708693.1 hypothetical protein [Microbispora oryzae]
MTIALAGFSSQEIQFQVGQVQLEFHVGVSREGGVNSKARFWVLEVGTEGKYARESIQKVSLTLEPLTKDGQPIHVSRDSAERP